MQMMVRAIFAALLLLSGIEVRAVSTPYYTSDPGPLRLPSGAELHNRQLFAAPVCTQGIWELYANVVPSTTTPLRIDSLVQVAGGVLGQNVPTFADISRTWGPGNYLYMSANSLACPGIAETLNGGAWVAVTVDGNGAGTLWPMPWDGPVPSTPLCDVANPVVPCRVGTTTYDTFAGNYTSARHFYRAESYTAVVQNSQLCLTIKPGLPNLEGYGFAPGLGQPVWTSPQPYNVWFGIFGGFSSSCIAQINEFQWIGAGSPNPPTTCLADLPLRWPTPNSSQHLSQDFAEFNGWPKVRPSHYHTGLDIASLQSGTPQDALAAAKGEVVAACPNGVQSGCSFGGKVFSTTQTNHGMQGAVILRHTLADGTKFYSLYAHLSVVETLTPDQCVGAGERLGRTGGVLDAHLHFEIKDRPVLHNPSFDVEQSLSCIDPGSGQQSAKCWGYTSVHPESRGYKDPAGYLHRVDRSGFPRTITVTRKGAAAFTGPGGLTGAYPTRGDAPAGSYRALGTAPNSGTPNCPGGWYQIQNVPNDCTTSGQCFGKNKARDLIPDAWVCATFVGP